MIYDTTTVTAEFAENFSKALNLTIDNYQSQGLRVEVQFGGTGRSDFWYCALVIAHRQAN